MHKGFLFFILLSVLHLLFIGLHLDSWVNISKTLLIPLLIIVTFSQNTFKTKRLLISALGWSWLGDVLLIFAPHNDLFFIAGLASFLLAHVFYVILFIKQDKQSDFLWKQWLPAFLGVFIYLFIFLTLLFPYLKEMKLPVIIYSLVISTMFLFAYKGLFQWHSPCKKWVLLGAIFFLMSDSILAFNKFHTSIPLSGVWIMMTYLLAQGSITFGILKMNDESLQPNSNYTNVI